jgi:thymidylate synthase (FAD)
MKIVSPGYSFKTIDGEEIVCQIERIGRLCYKSEGNIEPGSAHKFVAKLIKRGHEAMLEHGSITVKFVCDRGISHEIVRHRMAAYAQESTRYCNYADDKFDNQIAVVDIGKHMSLDSLVEWTQAMADAEKHYFKLLELGNKPEIARSVLPNSLKTEIYCTYNLREWRHFFRLRTAPTAHPQMREITIPLLKEFKSLVPVVFDDIVI